MAEQGKTNSSRKSPAGPKVGVTLPNKTIASKARVTDPGFRREAGSPIQNRDYSHVNESIQRLRNAPVYEQISALSRSNGIFSAAVHSYIQMAMSGYIITSYSAGTHKFDLAASKAAVNVVVSADTLYDYTVGYADKQTTDSLLETLLKETLQTGACALELVLNRFRLPEKLVAVPVPGLKWKSAADGTAYPYQTNTTTGKEVSLDIPTFFYMATHAKPNQVYPHSPLEAALQMIFVFTEFLEDLSRVLRRSGHTRTIVRLVEEAVRKSATPAVQADPIKLAKFFEDTRRNVEAVLENLDPQDALVLYDTAEVAMLSTSGDKSDYSSLLQTLGAMMASSLKSMSSVLGLGQGSQNLATAEALIYVKMVRSLQVPVEAVMSRAITLAMRLMTGTDAYCHFEFLPVNLRPADELSAHQSVLFQNDLSKLSLGLYSDEEFAWRQGVWDRPEGSKKLSGLMFINPEPTQPQDVQNSSGAGRALNSGTKDGSKKPQGGGSPQPSKKPA